MAGYSPKRTVPPKGRTVEIDKEAASPPKPCFHEYAWSASSRMSDLNITITKASRWGLDSRDPTKVQHEDGRPSTESNPPNWRTILEQIGSVRGVLKDVEGYCAEMLTYTGLDRQPIVRDRLQQLMNEIGAQHLAYAMERDFTLDAVDLLKDQHFHRFIEWTDSILPSQQQQPEVASATASRVDSVDPTDDRRGFDRIDALINQYNEKANKAGQSVVGLLMSFKRLAQVSPSSAKSLLASSIMPGNTLADFARQCFELFPVREAARAPLLEALSTALSEPDDDDL